MSKPNIQTLKGFRDFLPAEKRKRDYVQQIIKNTFELWGFEPIETPTLESLELFTGQIGEDEKLFYKFKDYGDREVAMRYDQTVPTCRFVAQYRNELPPIFKRYQIQNVFRAEKPQKGRYREFTQADADIFGTLSPIADAETIALSLDIYRQLGFKNARVLFNDRSLMKGLPYEAIVAIDKLKKIGDDGVIADMEEKGIDTQKAKEYLSFVRNLQPNETVSIILEYLRKSGFAENWYQFDPTIARSFAYSDGPIWEVVIPEYTVGSVLGGERYNNLVKNVAGMDIPGTGFAIGFDRTVEAADLVGLIPTENLGSQVLVTIFDQSTLEKSLETASQLRQAGIKTEVYPAFDKLGKQFKLADQKKIPFVIIIGEDEIAKNVVTIKNMQTGEQEQFDINTLIQQIKK